MRLPNIFEKNTATMDFPTGATVFTAGEPGRHLYMVRDGEVDLRVDGRVVETVGPEGFFGEMALIDDGPRSADAVARTACTLVPVDQKQFLFMVAETSFFALVLLRTFSRRLRRAGTATVPAS